MLMHKIKTWAQSKKFKSVFFSCFIAYMYIHSKFLSGHIFRGAYMRGGGLLSEGILFAKAYPMIEKE